MEAVLKVLSDEKKAMKYDSIADIIVAQNLRPANKIGSTPANTVNVTLRNLMRDEKSGVAVISRGVYILKQYI